MKRFLGRLTSAFASGSLGALANSLTAWLFGLGGITAAAGVKMAPPLTPEWLYPRIVWGGLWGLLLLLPILPGSAFVRGIVISLAPTAVQLFILFPFKLGKGVLGLDLGYLTPLFVILFNCIWGIVAAVWLNLVSDQLEKRR